MMPTPIVSSMRFRFVLFFLCFWLCFWVNGCASFPAGGLPPRTYADLPPAPAEKACLVVSDHEADGDRETAGVAVALLEKSGYFLKTPEECAPGAVEGQEILTVVFENNQKAKNTTIAAVSGLVFLGTLTIVPAYVPEDYLLTARLTQGGRTVKEYSYQGRRETWLHVSLLCATREHPPRAAASEIRERLIMNFLYDYSRDRQQAGLPASGP